MESCACRTAPRRACCPLLLREYRQTWVSTRNVLLALDGVLAGERDMPHFPAVLAFLVLEVALRLGVPIKSAAQASNLAGIHAAALELAELGPVAPGLPTSLLDENGKSLHIRGVAAGS